jgi:protein-L-isoaspartate(D-aspartate) O-methyltransferase
MADEDEEIQFYQNFNTNDQLISYFERRKLWSHKEIYEAMRKVDRADFVSSKARPYDDCPQLMGYGVTVSAPHMHGYALEYLFDKLSEGSNVLDVGSGSGILCAYMAHLVGEKGKITGIEHIKELCEASIKNLQKHHSEFLENGRIEIHCGDGRKGYESNAPYDAIHVGAAANESACETLCKQLKPKGMMVVPVAVGKSDDDEKDKDKGKDNNSWGFISDDTQWFRIYQKDEDGKIAFKNLMSVRYVPLTDEKKQRNNA